MDKHFKFRIGATLADLFNFIQRQFAGQNDPLNAHAFPEIDRCIVDGIGLHRQMYRHVRPGFPRHHNQTRISHNQGVRFHSDNRGNILNKGFNLGVMRNHISCQEKLFTQLMSLSYAFGQIILKKIIVAHPKAVTRQPGINRIRTVCKSIAHVFKGSGRRK